MESAHISFDEGVRDYRRIFGRHAYRRANAVLATFPVKVACFRALHNECSILSSLLIR